MNKIILGIAIASLFCIGCDSDDNKDVKADQQPSAQSNRNADEGAPSESDAAGAKPTTPSMSITRHPKMRRKNAILHVPMARHASMELAKPHQTIVQMPVTQTMSVSMVPALPKRCPNPSPKRLVTIILHAMQDTLV